jgi:hypothetical protein
MISAQLEPQEKMRLQMSSVQVGITSLQSSSNVLLCTFSMEGEGSWKRQACSQAAYLQSSSNVLLQAFGKHHGTWRDETAAMQRTNKSNATAAQQQSWPSSNPQQRHPLPMSRHAPSSNTPCLCRRMRRLRRLSHSLHVLQVLCRLAPMLSKHLYSVTPVVAQVSHL